MTDITNAPADAGGALSLDQAEALLKRDEPVEQQPAPTGEAEAEETPSGDQPETTAGEAETPDAAEPGEAEEPAEPAVQAPTYWSAEAKAKFAELPPEMQSFLAEQAKGDESFKGKLKQETAAARKAADQEAGAYRERTSRLGELLPQLEATVAGEWADWLTATPDVLAAAAQADPAAFTARKAQFDAAMAKLASAKEEHARADADAHHQHVTTLVDQLSTVAPELADEREGPKRVQQVFAYLGSLGIAADQLKWVTAPQLAIAHKAMRFDQGQAALKAAPKPQPKPASPALRPAAAPAGSSQQRTIAGLSGRLTQTGKLDDAVALLQARDAAKGR